MTSEVFNPNPTIIVTAGPSARRRVARQSLWLSDDEDSTIYDSDDEPEPIDADEIFGGIPSFCLIQPTRLKACFSFLLLRSDSFN
jgi:hypothetical protein